MQSTESWVLESPTFRMPDFDRACALILANLYQSFPVPSNIDVRKLDANVSGELERTFGGTMEFLADEGYLRYATPPGPRTRGLTWNSEFFEVVLTSKGLAVLDAIPQTLTAHWSNSDAAAAVEVGRLTRGKRLTESLKSEATEAIRPIIREIISEGIKYTLRH